MWHYAERPSWLGRSFFAGSVSAPVLGKLTVLPLAGGRASSAEVRGLVGLGQIHSYQPGPVHGPLGRSEQPGDLAKNGA